MIIILNKKKKHQVNSAVNSERLPTAFLTSSVFASVIDLLSLGGSWMCLLRPPSTRGRTRQNTLMLPYYRVKKNKVKDNELPPIKTKFDKIMFDCKS